MKLVLKTAGITVHEKKRLKERIDKLAQKDDSPFHLSQAKNEIRKFDTDSSETIELTIRPRFDEYRLNRIIAFLNAQIRTGEFLSVEEPVKTLS